LKNGEKLGVKMLIKEVWSSVVSLCKNFCGGC